MRTRPPGTPDIDLTDSGDFGTINDAVFTTGLTQPAGTGTFSSFVQIQHGGTEQGYNTDASAQFDEKNSHQHNHSILLAEVPIVIGDGANGTIEGRAYREFLLDLNESGAGGYVSLDALQIWQEESGALTNFTPGSGFAGSHTNYLAYNLDAGGDHWIALNDGLSHGSGQSDVRILIPDTAFINDATHRYVTLYSKFGEQSGWGADGGFEEWGLHGANGGSVAALALNKSAAVPGGTADHAGEIITYTFQLSNTGNTSLTGVTLADPSVSDLVRGADIIGNNDNILNAGEMWSFTAHRTVTQDEIDASPTGEGIIVNTATADTDQTGAVSAVAIVSIDRDPHVTLTKQASVPGGTADTVGEVISYAIAVTNDGNTTLTGAYLTDSTVSNLAPVVNPSSPILTPVTSGEDIIGDTNGNFIQDPGEVWTFRNIGDVNQNGMLDFGEEFQFHNSGDTNADGKLSVGETWHYTASHAVSQDDIDNGGIVDPHLAFANTARVDTDQGAIDVDTVSVPIEQRPHVTLDKVATVPGGSADSAGEIIDYQIGITNDGNMTLTDPLVTDPSVSDLAAIMSGGFNIGDSNMDGKLSVGETWQYDASHTVTQPEMDAGGSISNTASVTTAQGATDSDSASITVEQHPHIVLDKVATVPGGTADTAGEVISYAISITNDGNVSLTGASVTDSSVSDLAAVTSGGFNIGDSNSDGKLSVGETWQYSASHTVTQGEIDAGGSISNTASVTTTQGATASGSASVTVVQPVAPGLKLDISDAVGTIFVDSDGNLSADANGQDKIEWVFALTNTGTASLSNIHLTDLLGENATVADSPDPDGHLDPGDTWIFSHNHVLTAADVSAGHVFDQATATALDPSSNPLSVMAHFDYFLP